jgi:SAM-dependent methyltransferase
MPQDKSLFFYGRPYHAFIDVLLKEHRAKILSLIPEDSVVLDVGCGTGELALLLREAKACRVVGVDLSLRMVEFARGRNPYSDVVFLHRDAADISDHAADHFDYAILLQVLHELPRATQLAVLAELGRLAKKTLIVDYNVPLPRHLPGIVSRVIEITIGRDHYDQFRAYITAGGVAGILEEAGLSTRMAQRLEFNNGCHQVVVLG